MYMIFANKKFNKAEKIRDLLYPATVLINLIPAILLFALNDWYVEKNVYGPMFLFIPVIFILLFIADYRHFVFYGKYNKTPKYKDDRIEGEYFTGNYLGGLYVLIFLFMALFLVIMGITYRMM